MKNSALAVLLSLICGFMGGGLGSMRPWGPQKVLRAEALELAESQGIRVYLGPTKRGSALQFLDHERHLRAQMAADEQSSQIDLQNERYEATLAVGSLPGFSMRENNMARLGFGLE